MKNQFKLKFLIEKNQIFSITNNIIKIKSEKQNEEIFVSI